ETRLLLLLQGTAFMTMFRESMQGRGALADTQLEKVGQAVSLPAGSAQRQADSLPHSVDEIFADVSRDRGEAARKTYAYLQAGGSLEAQMTAARRLIFLKGADAHDYKFSCAALEDYYHVSPAWRNHYLATSMFNLRGTGHQ